MRASLDLILDLIDKAKKNLRPRELLERLENFSADFTKELERLVAAIYDKEYQNSEYSRGNVKSWVLDKRGADAYIREINRLADILNVTVSKNLLISMGGNLG